LVQSFERLVQPRQAALRSQQQQASQRVWLPRTAALTATDSVCHGRLTTDSVCHGRLTTDEW
jgi:hypothetical protein